MTNWTIIFLVAIPIVIFCAQLFSLVSQYRLENKLDGVHEMVNSNLSKTQAELATALLRVTHLEVQVVQLKDTISVLKSKVGLSNTPENHTG